MRFHEIMEFVEGEKIIAVSVGKKIEGKEFLSRMVGHFSGLRWLEVTTSFAVDREMLKNERSIYFVNRTNQNNMNGMNTYESSVEHV